MFSNSKNNIRIHCKKAVVLAAGEGKRLRPATLNTPKPLIEVNGQKIIFSIIDALHKVGISDILIVVGYKYEMIINTLNNKYSNIKIQYIINSEYSITGNFYSLYLTRSFLSEDVLVLDSDLLINEDVLYTILSNDCGNIAAVAPFKPTMSGNIVTAKKNKIVESFISSQSDNFRQRNDYYKTLNIYLIKKEFLQKVLFPCFEIKIEKTKFDHFDKIILESSANRTYPLYIADCQGLSWYEIDDLHDLEIANYIFSSKEKQYKTVINQHGSYWKYDFKDHCLLYNLYFPPKDFFSNLRNCLEEIVKVYPGSQLYSTQALSRYLNQPAENIIVSNGSSELIKIIVGRIFKNVIVPIPSFNEYENVVDSNNLFRFNLDKNFNLDEKKFINTIYKNRIELAVIVNPNNPTSLVVSKDKIIKILEALKLTSCILLIDESFIDFVDDHQNVSLEKDIKTYNNLAILKSIGKTYGVGGIRLGYLLTSNLNLIKKIRENLPIWNINGFAEYFLNLLSRYQIEYKISCDKIRNDREEFYNDLLNIKGLQVYRPQANFIFCKLPDGVTANFVARKLFKKYNILIKECSGKSMYDANKYIRLSCRTTSENKNLAAYLKNIIIGE